MKVLSLLIIVTSLAALFFVNLGNLTPERNDVTIVVKDNSFENKIIKIAVVGDPHLSENKNALLSFAELMEDIKSAQPDLVVFVGDYTDNPSNISNMSQHRSKIAKTISSLDPIKTAIVLGNYETWSDANKWYLSFSDEKLNILENEIALINDKKNNICVRGLGDFYTNRFMYIPFPEKCKEMVKITLTHDPAGAFHKDVTGLVISGHTHCGQIRFPLIGSLWVPTEAPSKAHCGLYKDSQRTVFTTSGIGTALLPLRIGTQAQWDFLTIEIGS